MENKVSEIQPHDGVVDVRDLRQARVVGRVRELLDRPREHRVFVRQALDLRNVELSLPQQVLQLGRGLAHHRQRAPAGFEVRRQDFGYGTSHPIFLVAAARRRAPRNTDRRLEGGPVPGSASAWGAPVREPGTSLLTELHEVREQLVRGRHGSRVRLERTLVEDQSDELLRQVDVRLFEVAGADRSEGAGLRAAHDRLTGGPRLEEGAVAGGLQALERRERRQRDLGDRSADPVAERGRDEAIAVDLEARERAWPEAVLALGVDGRGGTRELRRGALGAGQAEVDVDHLVRRTVAREVVGDGAAGLGRQAAGGVEGERAGALDDHRIDACRAGERRVVLPGIHASAREVDRRLVAFAERVEERHDRQEVRGGVCVGRVEGPEQRIAARTQVHGEIGLGGGVRGGHRVGDLHVAERAVRLERGRVEREALHERARRLGQAALVVELEDSRARVGTGAVALDDEEAFTVDREVGRAAARLDRALVEDLADVEDLRTGARLPGAPEGLDRLAEDVREDRPALLEAGGADVGDVVTDDRDGRGGGVQPGDACEHGIGERHGFFLRCWDGSCSWGESRGSASCGSAELDDDASGELALDP